MCAAAKVQSLQHNPRTEGTRTLEFSYDHTKIAKNRCEGFSHKAWRSKIDQIERKFNVNIKLDSNQLNKISITGVIDAEDLDGVLTTLAILSQRSYRFEKETYIFY